MLFRMRKRVHVLENLRQPIPLCLDVIMKSAHRLFLWPPHTALFEGTTPAEKECIIPHFVLPWSCCTLSVVSK